MADKFQDRQVLAKIENLKMRMGSGKKLIIDDVSFQVRKGEVLGLIGESGSGKTVVTSTLTGLNINVQHIDEGKIFIKDQDVTEFDFDDWSDSGLRGCDVSQVFQNPLSSLNPYRTVGSQIIESLMINAENEKARANKAVSEFNNANSELETAKDKLASETDVETKSELEKEIKDLEIKIVELEKSVNETKIDSKYTKEDAYEEAIEYLEKVKIHNVDEVMRMYPHQMSGGMNQRIVIVTILATKPDLIIFDEPTTALDPLAQAQIVEIIREIKDDFEVGIVFISHDLALVSSIADTIAIMYAGRIVEQGTAEEIIHQPRHPYTWGLLMSMPDFIDGSEEKLFSIRGTVPANIETIEGDAFAPRNDFALEVDFKERPPKFDITDTHFVYSWLYDKNAPKFEPPKVILDNWNKVQKKPTTAATAKKTTTTKKTTSTAKKSTPKKTTSAKKTTTAKKPAAKK